MFWEMLGLVATLCIMSSYIPQIVRSYRTKRMEDISLAYLSIIAAGVFLWIIYGIHISDPVIIYANVAIFTLAVSLILMRIHYSGLSG
jgi:MtN3 and saliva related transmembrane protein